MAKKYEESLQTAVCDYLRLQYPRAMFVSDASGVRLTMGQAVKMKRLRSAPGWPDLFIAFPVGKYHGLFIELKKQGETIHKKDGSFASDHIKEQYETLKRLTDIGYVAEFAVGFDQAKWLIDQYFANNLEEILGCKSTSKK